ncbi:hypothetical protein [Nonlabens ponticola]|uniref:Outer membrane protein beta-barrel domain-containing protein n=1 Tax=Nonlabens ponticola TaxID=2496866 RepID=A0A3S9N0A0_9FLAO|nr:hypothetical protein [Nonlabens ponticola]AZQ44809.1 hypothetical protein EJ995_11410 [Nonlabens ponticola]
MKHFFTLLFFFFLVAVQAQTNKEDAYRVDESGSRTIGKIKISEFLKNPDRVEFYPENGQQVVMTPFNTRSFGTLEDGLLYQSSKIDVDLTSDVEPINKVSPTTIEKQVFLKILIKGEGTLAEYSSDNNTRYYVKTGTSDFKLLNYQEYLTADGSQIGKSRDYQRQIAELLDCNSTDYQKLGGLGYNRKDLLEYVIDYNECTNKSYSIISRKNNLSLLSGRINAGVSSQTLSPSKDYFRQFDGVNETSIHVSGILEVRFDRKRDNWSIISEIAYNSQVEGSSTYQQQFTGNGLEFRDEEVYIESQSIDITIGALKYLYLNEKMSLLLSAQGGISNVSSDSFIEFGDNGEFGAFPLSDLIIYKAGIAAEFKNKISFKIEYFGSSTTKESTVNAEVLKSGLNLKVGYRIF